MIGEIIGQYRIDSPLGEGGMGTVYRAFDTKLNRPVAVKFLSDSVADAPTRRRFQREAQMASSLNHPHIVTVFDVGESGGRQYIVTELVDGGTLKDWVAAESRSWRQIIGLLTDVADGLSAAHDAGILHRDVKPANILVAKNGYAKLVDFGLAKHSEQHDSLTTHTLTAGPTMPGEIVGTASYMSPEQAVGKPLDVRSDIFSFGVVLYELLAGRRPFSADSIPALLYKILHAAPDPLPGELPPALSGLVEKAIEKDPADRYQSMRELVVDLRRLSRQSSPATAATPAAVQKKSRLPLVAAATIAAVLTLAAGYRKLS